MSEEKPVQEYMVVEDRLVKLGQGLERQFITAIAVGSFAVVGFYLIYAGRWEEVKLWLSALFSIVGAVSAFFYKAKE